MYGCSPTVYDTGLIRTAAGPLSVTDVLKPIRGLTESPVTLAAGPLTVMRTPDPARVALGPRLKAAPPAAASVGRGRMMWAESATEDGDAEEESLRTQRRATVRNTLLSPFRA